MLLTAEVVESLFLACLAGSESNPKGVVVEGITTTVLFDAEKLQENRDEIKGLLSQLPVVFFDTDTEPDGKGGMSFLLACMDRSGLQWGEHKDMEQLFQLGVAAGFVDLLLAREYWKFLPGDVPYYAISFNESRVCQSPRYQG